MRQEANPERRLPQRQSEVLLKEEGVISWACYCRCLKYRRAENCTLAACRPRWADESSRMVGVGWERGPGNRSCKQLWGEVWL